MSVHWTENLSAEFWNAKPIHMVTRDDMSYRQIVDMLQIQSTRDEFQRTIQHQFLQKHAEELANNNSTPYVGMQVASNLEFWSIHLSWTYCKTCHLISPQKLLPQYGKRQPLKTTRACRCSTHRYIIPKLSDIPSPLRDLSMNEVRALRPLTIHSGNYERMQHGYQRKTDILRIKWSLTDIDTQIQQLEDPSARQRCQNAHSFLMNSEESSYSTFVQRRADAVRKGTKFNLYNSDQSAGVECALWPQLYPYRNWCETITDGRQSRLSTKIGFLCKVLSELVDYGLLYDLLHFHYDLWLFRTVSGAIATGRRMNCSPARALENKTFSTGYWRWQHRCLVDAVLQFGFPTIFVTISPYEWTFPFPEWLERIRTLTGRGPTQLAAFETMHMTHILEQVVRGYLCGSNTNRWTSHVFGNERRPTSANVKTYFYRFEFQERGTAHLHLLVWLNDVSQIRHNLIRADVPWSTPEMAPSVAQLQKSDRNSLPVYNGPTQVVREDRGPILHIHHPRDAFEMHLRAYISSLLPSLKCRMDAQTTDGKTMLLRYVTSYVTKWHDAYSNDALYSNNVGPFQAAYRHLKEMKPLEPEMWLALSSVKIAWTPSRCKRFIVPTSQTLPDSSIHNKYKARDNESENVSLLQWLRQFDESKTPPRKYAAGTTLVAIKMRSPFNDEYFFQHLLLNVPHRSIEIAYHRDFQQLPNQIKFFAAALSHNSQLWQNDNLVADHFSNEGHRDYFIQTIVAHVASLRDFYSLWQRQIFGTNMIQPDVQDATATPADPQQAVVLRTFQEMMHHRDMHYNNVHCVEEPTSDDDLDANDEPELQKEQHEHAAVNATTVDWKKFLLLTGKPGTGKSHALKLVIRDCIDKHRRVLVAVPTGFLATQYKAEFDAGISSDTIHSSFQFPVLPDERPTVNWNIADYDAVIIDELSMVSTTIFQHVIQTINEVTIRPIVVLCGDDQQQQPIETVKRQVVQAESIMHHRSFRAMVRQFKLTTQHRTQDDNYNDFLNYIRNWRPTTRQLNTIQADRILCAEEKPSDTDIIHALRRHPTATVLTVSRSATNRINVLFMKELFASEEPLAEVPSDCALQTIPIYHGLRVMITQNRDKENGVVNGQQGIIQMMYNKTIFVKLSANKIVPLYLVTNHTPNGNIQTVYPFMPCYSLTICKAQGQTLTSCIVWFDVVNVPAGSGYVALSRVKTLNDLYLLTPMKPAHFTPVTPN